jgi:N-methylhydantoinase A
VPVDLQRVNENFAGLVNQAGAELHAAGFKNEDIKIIRSVDMRYRYQVHELNVPFTTEEIAISPATMDALYARFDALYEKAYGQGSAYREAGKEIIVFRATAIGELPKPELERERTGETGAQHAVKGTRDVYFEEFGEFASTSVYDFDRLKPGNEVRGPSVIETPVTTIVVNPKDRASMDELRNIIVFVGG